MIEAIRKVVRNGQITLPAKVREALSIKTGDLLRLEVKNKQLVITPVATVSKHEAYFFSGKSQKAIKESETAVKQNRYSRYRSGQDLKREIEG